MAKKHKCPDPPADTTRWMGTYGDMVTLLMAFFVMLFAVSETNNQKFEAFVAGLAGPFDNPSLELGLVSGAAQERSNPSPLDLISPNPDTNVGNGELDATGQMIAHIEALSAAELREAAEDADVEISEEELEELARMDAVAQQLEFVERRVEAALNAVDVPVNADLRDDERGLIIAISTDEVLFRTGSAELSGDGQTVMGQLAPILVDSPNTVVIEGHTDDAPLNRGGYTNWNLSTDRAVAVLQYLGDSYGMPYQRISAAGYGEHRPLVPNDTRENMAINRRVEVLIVAMDMAGIAASPNEEPRQTAEADTPAAEAPDVDVPAVEPGSEGDVQTQPAEPLAPGASGPVLDFSEEVPTARNEPEEDDGSTPVAAIFDPGGG